MKKDTSKLLNYVIYAILLVIMVVSGYRLMTEDKHISKEIKSFEPKITQEVVHNNKTNKDKANYDMSKVSSVNYESILEARKNSDKILFVGYVAVPDLNLSLPISLGSDDLNLSLGAGTMYPNQEMGQGNYPLSSHYMKTDKSLLFTPIVEKGKVGQKMYLTDLDHVYEYTTTMHEVVDETNGDPLKEGSVPLLTLITCNVESEDGRVIQQGELTKTYTWEETPKEIKDALVGSDNRWIK